MAKKRKAAKRAAKPKRRAAKPKKVVAKRKAKKKAAAKPAPAAKRPGLFANLVGAATDAAALREKLEGRNTFED